MLLLIRQWGTTLPQETLPSSSAETHMKCWSQEPLKQAPSSLFPASCLLPTTQTTYPPFREANLMDALHKIRTEEEQSLFQFHTSSGSGYNQQQNQKHFSFCLPGGKALQYIFVSGSCILVLNSTNRLCFPVPTHIWVGPFRGNAASTEHKCEPITTNFLEQGVTREAETGRAYAQS